MVSRVVAARSFAWLVLVIVSSSGCGSRAKEPASPSSALPAGADGGVATTIDVVLSMRHPEGGLAGHADISFGGTPQRVHFEADAQASGKASARYYVEGYESLDVIVEISEDGVGSLRFGGETIDAQRGDATAKEKGALNALGLSIVGTAVMQVPLQLGCELTFLEFDAERAALVFPWQLLLKYEPEIADVYRAESQSSCKYFEKGDQQLPTGLVLNAERPFPFVFGFYPLELPREVGVAVEKLVADSHTSPQGTETTTCRGACGADCDRCDLIEADTEEWCDGDTRLFSMYVDYECGTHEGCVEHDACYDMCLDAWEGMGYSADELLCYRRCDIECLCTYDDFCEAHTLVSIVAGARTLPQIALNAGIELASTQCVHWIFGASPVGRPRLERVSMHDHVSTSAEPCARGEVCDEGMCVEGGDAGVPVEPEDAGTDASTQDVPDAGEPVGGSGGTGGSVTIVPGRPGNTAFSIGDPHLRTFDGLRYDMQAGGEFTLVHDATDQLEVQLRTRSWQHRHVSVGVAVAARVVTDRLGFYRDDGTTRLNGVPVAFVEGRNELPGGGALYREGDVYTVVWPDNAQLVVRGRGSSVSLFFPNSRRGGGVAGLLGDFDGVGEGDLASRDGAALGMRPSFEDFYGVFVESWRVTPQTTLFDYEPGEQPEDFALPGTRATTRDLTAVEYGNARTECEAAGVPEDWMDSCILDVGMTGDPSFADDLVDAPPSTTVEIDPPVCPGLSSGPLCVSPDTTCSQAAYTCNGTFPDCACTAAPIPPPGPTSCAQHADCPGGLCYADAGCGAGGTCGASQMCLAPSAGAPVCACNGLTYATGCAALAAGSIGFAEGACPPLDLQSWTQEGAAGNGNWQVAADGLSVLQTLNGDPTFFVSPESFINTAINGSFRVETTGDDDIVGFVLGYNAPLSSEGDAEDTFDFVLFDWKQVAQSSSGQLAPEGFTLSRVQGMLLDPWAPFWGHNATGVDVLATSYGPDLGWTANADHVFQVIYEATRIRISVDNVPIFDVAGDFPEGRFGFYNFSQAQVRYRNFVASGSL